MKEKTYTITADTGVHARPATLLVHQASQYKSDIEITYREKSVNLKSIMGVMSLGIPKGAQVTITADGEDEDEAIQGISEVMEEHLGDSE
ncbi:MAG TPA: phosphocarrier protein HPr [Bacillota bacterium]